MHTFYVCVAVVVETLSFNEVFVVASCLYEEMRRRSNCSKATPEARTRTAVEDAIPVTTPKVSDTYPVKRGPAVCPIAIAAVAIPKALVREEGGRLRSAVLAKAVEDAISPSPNSRAEESAPALERVNVGRADPAATTI